MTGYCTLHSGLAAAMGIMVLSGWQMVRALVVEKDGCALGSSSLPGNESYLSSPDFR